MKSDGPIRVLIVQASPLFHTLVSGALSRCRDICILPGASTPAEVRDRILACHPDVVLFDLALPEQGGSELLRNLREYYPVPVIACSGSRKHDGQRALSAIEEGVLDIVVKPPGPGARSVRELGQELSQKIRTAVAEARPVPTLRLGAGRRPGLSFRAAGINPRRHVIVVGASTGGTEAIRELLSQLPADTPGVAIVQHMPAMFTSSFAERLNICSLLRVTEAVDGDLLPPGRAVVARGDTHMVIRAGSHGWYAHYTHQRPVNRHCPSVDELFDSAAEVARKNAIGILLSGMGGDGAKGLLRLRQRQALTVAQDADSCVVFGMPKVAQQLGAVQLSGAPGDIPRLVVQVLAQRERRSVAASQSAP